ncbi:cysteate racemase [Guggenheimella bovis]
MRRTIVGILGGMGPEAGAQLFLKITKKTPIETEQDHFHILLDSNPQVPDRTRAILFHETSPVDTIAEMANRLYEAGARVGVIPCMTSHYFLEEVEKRTPLTFIHAYKELNRYLKEHYPTIKKVGVMCTDGSRQAGLFEKFLEAEVLYPEPDKQRIVMDGIYGPEGVKQGFTTGKPVDQFEYVAAGLIERGAEVIVAGCTEIGFVMKGKVLGIDIVDSLDVLAEAVVRCE